MNKNRAPFLGHPVSTVFKVHRNFEKKIFLQHYFTPGAVTKSSVGEQVVEKPTRRDDKE